MREWRRERVDVWRYRRLLWFFARFALQLVWWDFLLARLGLDGLGRPRIERLVDYTTRFRDLAIEMGGVLIKLGQFLSVRVDALPVEITRELSGLQDAVPPCTAAEIVARIEADFGMPIGATFPGFELAPVAAASLAQVHLATLPSGERVALKVLRPGIEKAVYTDLRVIEVVLGWLRHVRAVRDRFDVDRVIAEFIAVTSNELDTGVEMSNAERIARDFADNHRLMVPWVSKEYSREHVLTMEYVEYIRCSDMDGLERAGIDRTEVAKAIYNLFLDQFFLTHFVHADPHPGNIYIRPLPLQGESIPPGRNVARSLQPGCKRDFQVVLVDFGMMVEIPKRLRTALREYAIGLGLKDAHRIVEAYVKGGVLRAGADLKVVEEGTRVILDRLPGMLTGLMKDIDSTEARKFFSDYQEYTQAPFQFQSELLFVLRAMGTLAGLVTQLDPDFDMEAELEPFAMRLIRDESELRYADLLNAVIKKLRVLWELPDRMEFVLRSAAEGELEFRASVHKQPEVRRLRSSIQRLAWAVTAVGMFVSGVVLYCSSVVTEALGKHAYINQRMSVGVMIAAIPVLLWGLARGDA